MAQSDRMIWLDALRLIAGISIVGLHASSDPNGLPFPDALPSERVAPLVFRMFVYTARTELFLIISIFLLLMALERRPRGYGATIKEQTRRLLVPFAFWTIFYAFYGLIKAYSYGYQASVYNELQTVSAWLGYFVLGDVKYHMHFIPTLFALLLFYPLYLIAIKHPWLGLLVIVSLAAKREMDLFMWANLQDMPGFDYLVRFVKVITYGAYGMIAGSFWGIYKKLPTPEQTKPWFMLVCYLGLLLLGIKAVFTYRVAMAGNWQYNFNPAYWADFIMPALLFAALMLNAHRAWPPVISKLSPYSFGIYLSHPIFLDLFESITRNASFSPTVYVSLKVGVGLFLTCLFVALLKQIPFLAWTIGLGKIPYFEKPLLAKTKPVASH